MSPSPCPSPSHKANSLSLKFRRSPLSLFFPSFSRSTASTSTDKSPTSPCSIPTVSIRRAKFRNASSMDTPRSEDEGKPKRNGYRALLTPEPFGTPTSPSYLSSHESIQHLENHRQQKPPPKSVSFQDLITYPAALHQAIQSFSPRKSIRPKLTSLSINSNLHLAETPKIKRSLSNYFIRCEFDCCVVSWCRMSLYLL